MAQNVATMTMKMTSTACTAPTTARSGGRLDSTRSDKGAARAALFIVPPKTPHKSFTPSCHAQILSNVSLILLALVLCTFVNSEKILEHTVEKMFT